MGNGEKKNPHLFRGGKSAAPQIQPPHEGLATARCSAGTRFSGDRWLNIASCLLSSPRIGWPRRSLKIRIAGEEVAGSRVLQQAARELEEFSSLESLQRDRRVRSWTMTLPRTWRYWVTRALRRLIFAQFHPRGGTGDSFQKNGRLLVLREIEIFRQLTRAAPARPRSACPRQVGQARKRHNVTVTSVTDSHNLL